jgi:hypothetical protein
MLKAEIGRRRSETEVGTGAVRVVGNPTAKEEGRMQNAEGGRGKAESRKQSEGKAESRKQKAEILKAVRGESRN